MAHRDTPTIDCELCGGKMYQVKWCSEGRYKCDGCMGDMVQCGNQVEAYECFSCEKIKEKE